VLAANIRDDLTRAMIFPVMGSHANMGAGVMAAVRRAKRSGTGVPPVRFQAATCCQRFRLPLLFLDQTPDLHPLISARCLCNAIQQSLRSRRKFFLLILILILALLFWLRRQPRCASVVQNSCLRLPCADFACFAVENPARSDLNPGKSK